MASSTATTSPHAPGDERDRGTLEARGERDPSALEVRLARLERAAAELRRLPARSRSDGSSAPLAAALHAFSHDIAVTRGELRRLMVGRRGRSAA